MMNDERQLLEALRRREESAFAELFNAQSDKLFRLAVGLLKDEDEAEGVVQEAFIRLFERLDQFEGRSKLSTWLYRVTYNLSMDRLRQRKPTTRLDEILDEETAPFMPAILVDWSAAPEMRLDGEEVRRTLDKAIAELPEKLRAVFILRDVEGLSTRETAQVLNLSESAAKVRLHRARLWLRERLSGYFLDMDSLETRS